MPLLQNYLGALCSGPEIRGPKFGARSSGPEVRAPTFMVQIYQKIFDYIIRNYIYEFLFYKVAWGTPHSGPGIRLLWHRYAKNHLITSLLFVYICFYMSLEQNYLGARCSGPEVRGPKFGARVLWHRYTKKYEILLTFAYMCFYMPLLQNCLGARRSGPDSSGIGME